jgi:hypothetical protein
MVMENNLTQMFFLILLYNMPTWTPTTIKRGQNPMCWLLSENINMTRGEEILFQTSKETGLKQNIKNTIIPCQFNRAVNVITSDINEVIIKKFYLPLSLSNMLHSETSNLL